MFEHLSLIKENFCHLNSSQLVCMLMMCYYTSMTLPDELLLDTAFSIILIKWYMSINEYKKCRSIMILNMLIAEEGLSRRGFEVTRLNTYTTVPVPHVDLTVLEQALSAPVVAVASPSAIRAWVNLTSESEHWDNAVACIGKTTALAAKRLGLRRVYHPTNPGLEG